MEAALPSPQLRVYRARAEPRGELVAAEIGLLRLPSYPQALDVSLFHATFCFSRCGCCWVSQFPIAQRMDGAICSPQEHRAVSAGAGRHESELAAQSSSWKVACAKFSPTTCRSTRVDAGSHRSDAARTSRESMETICKTEPTGFLAPFRGHRVTMVENPMLDIPSHRRPPNPDHARHAAFLHARPSRVLHAHAIDPSGLDRCASPLRGFAGSKK
jgi:hypothetical protein